MIIWPESLIREIAKKRVIFFLGSGVSASATSNDGEKTPTWGEFLELALNLVKTPEIQEEIRILIKNRNYLLALQAIKEQSIPQDYTALLEKQFNNHKIKAGKLHEHIFYLDQNIVITTNFDRIYDKYCDYFGEGSYKTLSYYSNGIGDTIRSDNRLIIKAHGCINEPEKMIFTRYEYHNAKQKHTQFYDILKALFITHTCIFIGCGMEDPDILLTLEDVKISSSNTFPHYFISLIGSSSSIEKRNLENNYNIKALEYGPSHEDLIEAIGNLREEVENYKALHGIINN
ncbi:SIR2 family protein [Photobacterium leiognathi]|uniref:SIR2 family protein n=1 Tax=Photobacterium leiognathi TaxID=553611 RepID=UPI0029828C9A|nr:SIR2 family protein [Photobacterium leiognathi]